MNDKYVIQYETPNNDLVVLITNVRHKKGLLDDATLEKLFLVLFNDEYYPYKKSLLLEDTLHGNIYNIELNKREVSEVFTIVKRNSFNLNGSRVKYVSLFINKNDTKELTDIDFKTKDLSLIYFIEHMKAKLNTLGYNKI